MPAVVASSAPAVPRPRIVRRALHGVLLLDKPVGLSSHDALQRAKRLYRAEKAGHTGTLDPLAGGLLPLAFGAATKFSQAGLDADKAYRATLRLGVTTTTADGEGEVLRRRPVTTSADDIAAACRGFVGEIDQLPPMHSALKRDGRPLYEYARAGIEVDRPTRRVAVHGIDVVAVDGADVVLDVRCGKGTYIRTLAEDLGEALGCGAYLTALRRTASGALGVAASCTLGQLEALDEAGRDALLLPVDALLADAAVLHLDDPAEASRFLSGLPRRVVDTADCALLRVYGRPQGDASVCLGTGRLSDGLLTAVRLLSPAEVQSILQQPPTVLNVPKMN